MTKKLQHLLEEYGESHQNATNKSIHWICVPAIFWSIVALLYSIPNSLLIELFGAHSLSNWAVVAMIPVLIYYFYLSVSATAGMLIFIYSCLFLSEILLHYSPVPLWTIAITVFVIAWIGQFYGHSIEGKKPSFLKDIQFLLIGPVWLLKFIYKRVGLKF